jgi:hypothetical protein
MKFYVATRLESADLAKKVIADLTARGHTVTYDWTLAGSVRGDAMKLRAVAEAEVNGVRTADVLILLLPGGRGAHTELGIAIGAGVPALIWSPDPAPLGFERETSAFYHHPRVGHVQALEDLPELLANLVDVPASREELEAALKLAHKELSLLCEYSGSAGNWPLHVAEVAARKALRL